MSLIKPSFVESMFHTFFQLDPDRPQYYGLVFRLGRSIFMQLGANQKIEELNNMIENKLESKLNAKLHAILKAYYNPRFLFSRLSYIRVGAGIDAIDVTRYEIETILEEMKDWVYDEVTNLTPYVRFTRQPDMIS